MLNLAALLVGPLVGPECRRALARGWVILVRWLAALAVMGVVLATVWWWWLVQQSDPYYQPYSEIRGALVAVEAMLLAIALVMGPAVLAGSLAGEKERGVLALLLTTRATSHEIVAGRVVGKLTQVAMPLLAGLPAVVALAALAGMGSGTLLVLLMLPFAVTIGGGGLAALASIVSRRGRDALLGVYLIDLVLLLSPLLGSAELPPLVLNVLVATNPFAGLTPLGWSDDSTVALISLGIWLALGVVGIAFASWRLRPSCLAQMSDPEARRRSGRRWVVPAVNERRPMLWKELFIERVGSLGRIGTWIGRLIVAGLLIGSIGLTGLLVWNVRSAGDPDVASWVRRAMAAWIGGTGGVLSALIQWAIGLRAAVSISSERERGTWDALMTSPLEAREIVGGKLWGSLYALRWLVAACAFAWVLGVVSDAVEPARAGWWTLDLLVIGGFMAAVGVRVSLECPTATKAMSITVAVWLVAYVVVSMLAALVLAVSALLLNLGWILMSQLGLAAPVMSFWTPVPMALAWPLANEAIYALLALLLVLDTRLRFDRLAGRMTGGSTALAFDRLLFGKPAAPVLLRPDLLPGATTTTESAPGESLEAASAAEQRIDQARSPTVPAP